MFTCPESERSCPDTSMLPPLPPSLPPRAPMVPASLVLPRLSTVMRPPLPLAVALAARRAPGAMITWLAVSPAGVPGPPRARARVVPTAMVPPPAAPEASRRALPASATVPVASRAMAPPFVPAAAPSASNVPGIRIEPPMPVMAIVPECELMLFASIVPPASTRSCTRPSVCRAVSSTVPPWAMIVPVLVTSAVAFAPFGRRTVCASGVTSSETSPSP